MSAAAVDFACAHPFLVAAAVVAVVVLLFFREQFKDMVSPPPGSQLGMIAAIYCYPIQSCGGVSLQEAQVTSTGIKYDRQWAVVPANGVTPFTLKTQPALARVMTAIENGECVVSAEGVRNPVRFPLNSKAQDLGENVNKWFSDFLGVPAKVVRVQQGGGDGDKTGFSDSSAGVLIVSEQSCTDLNTRIEKSQDMKVDSKAAGVEVLGFGHFRTIDVKNKAIAQEGVLPDGKIGDIYVKSKELGVLKTKQWTASVDSFGRVIMQTATNGFSFSSKAFRPNVVVMGGEGLPAFNEDTWKNVRFMGSGGPKLGLSFFNNRTAVAGVADGKSSNEPARTLMSYRTAANVKGAATSHGDAGLLGAFFTPQRTGTIRVQGDVDVIDYRTEACGSF